MIIFGTGTRGERMLGVRDAGETSEAGGREDLADKLAKFIVDPDSCVMVLTLCAKWSTLAIGDDAFCTSKQHITLNTRCLQR